MPPLAFGGAAAPRTKAENKNGQITHFQMGSVCRFPRVVLALGSVWGGKRDFIEHINLNLVTANSCLIKGVHITHINFFFFFFSWSPQARFPAHPISWQRRPARSGAGCGLLQGEMFIFQSLLAPSPGLFYCCRFKPSTYFLILWQRFPRALPALRFLPSPCLGVVKLQGMREMCKL